MRVLCVHSGEEPIYVHMNAVLVSVSIPGSDPCQDAHKLYKSVR